MTTIWSSPAETLYAVADYFVSGYLSDRVSTDFADALDGTTSWAAAIDSTSSWSMIALRYTTWDLGATHWDTDTTETFWDLGVSTDYTTTSDGTTVWT